MARYVLITLALTCGALFTSRATSSASSMNETLRQCEEIIESYNAYVENGKTDGQNMTLERQYQDCASAIDDKSDKEL